MSETRLALLKRIPNDVFAPLFEGDAIYRGVNQSEQLNPKSVREGNMRWFVVVTFNVKLMRKLRCFFIAPFAKCLHL